MARSSGFSPPHTEIHRLSRRFLEPAQDLLMLGLGLVLFALMARILAGLIRQLMAPAIDFRTVIAEVLFVLVMVELVRLLMIYLQEHRVAVDFMVELGMWPRSARSCCAGWWSSAGNRSWPSAFSSSPSVCCSGSATCARWADRRWRTPA